MSTITHCLVEDLVRAPEPYGPEWDCISGKMIKEYYTRSPWATIEAYERGFVVVNIVTGGKHPVATYNQASSLREQLARRYQTIATRAGW